MKKIVSYVLSVAGLFLLTSCNDAFLDRLPQDYASDANFWKTEPQLEAVCNSFTQALVGKDWLNRTEIMADSAPWAEPTGYRSIGGGNFNAMDSKVEKLWVRSYKNLSHVNYFLANCDRAEEVLPQVKNRYKAEAYFYKAFNYWLLTTYFGDVPFIEEYLDVDSEDLYRARDPKAEIIKKVTDELEEYYHYLPDHVEAASPDFGRVSQTAALALLSRIYLYNGMYDKTVNACERAMQSTYYRLYSTGKPDEDYVDLFNYKGRASRNAANHEVLLAYVYNYELGDEVRTSHNLSRECWVPDGYARFVPTKSMVECYLTDEGKIWDPKTVNSYEEVFQHRDPRMTQSILAPGTPWKGGRAIDKTNDDKDLFTYPLLKNTTKTSFTYSGYYMRKYVEPSIVPVVGHDDNDIILFRYAEVLLNYAEAKAHLGITQGDLDKSVNLLRDRVGMVHMDLADLPEGSDIMTEIQRERRVELFFEGHRYFDIIRWKQGELLAEPLLGVNKRWIDPERYLFSFSLNSLQWRECDGEEYLLIEENRHFDPAKNYLLPVPVSQRMLNTNLTQNPGWE